jgi:hypothetical protein
MPTARAAAARSTDFGMQYETPDRTTELALYVSGSSHIE